MRQEIPSLVSLMVDTEFTLTHMQLSLVVVQHLQVTQVISTMLSDTRVHLLMMLVCSIVLMYLYRWYVASGKTTSSHASDLRHVMA